MSIRCCIPFCTRAQEDPSILLHTFPPDPDTAAKWIRNVNLFLKNGGTFFPQADTALCSAHFLPSDFVPNSRKKVLKRRSVPSLFVWRDPKPSKPKPVIKKIESKSPMIVKVLRPAGEEDTSEAFLPIHGDMDDNIDDNVDDPPSKSNSINDIQVSKVISLSETNSLPASLPVINTSTLTTSASHVPKINPVLNPNQQLILLPQLPSSPVVGNAGFMVIPEGKPMPDLGKNLFLIPGTGPPPSLNGNVLLLQQPGISPLCNKGPDISKNFIPSTIPISTNSSSTFKSSILPKTSDNQNGNILLFDSNVNNNSREISTTNDLSKKDKTTYSPAIATVSRKHTFSEIDTSGEAKKVPAKRKRINYRKNQSTDLIEIAPSTFMKINPDIIKVAKKETPNGNTVLQFIMNPHLVNLDSKQPIFSFSKDKSVLNESNCSTQTKNSSEISSSSINCDTTLNDSIEDIHDPDSTTQNEDLMLNSLNSSVPILAAAQLPAHQSFMTTKMKYAKALRLKSSQVCKLTSKVRELEKKIEELENLCVVQERQLNFASLKRLKAIKKDADQGQPHANFILEQIRGYFNRSRITWSNSTMIQCSIWYRKAPYAYDYFKKADLFRLPALNTIKRFLIRNPEVKLQIKNKAYKKSCEPCDSSSSSDFDSDFDFDETDNENVIEAENETFMACENISAEYEDENPNSSTLKSNDINSNESARSLLLNIHSRPLLASDSSPEKRNSKSGDRQPLTNIFGKVLCHTTKKFEGNKIVSDVHLSSENTTEIIIPDVSQSEATHITAEEQTLLHEDECSNSQELASLDGVANEHELLADTTCRQELIITNDDSSGLIANDDSNNQVFVLGDSNDDDDADTYYLQTSEEDGVTTINVNGQEIVIPPGTILKLNSKLLRSDELGNHFLIIDPPEEESSEVNDQQYILSDSIPVETIEEPEMTSTADIAESTLETEVTEKPTSDMEVKAEDIENIIDMPTSLEATEMEKSEEIVVAKDSEAVKVNIENNETIDTADAQHEETNQITDVSASANLPEDLEDASMDMT